VHGDLYLDAADGSRFMAYAARAGKPSGAGMIVLPDVRGLFTFYKELAVSFAEAGFQAIALDYYSRIAPGEDRSEAFEWTKHNPLVAPEMVAADAQASAEYLRSSEGGGAGPIFVVGFCFGGSAAWRLSAQLPWLAGAIGFYGFKPLERVGPWISDMKSPILMLLAGADPPEECAEFADRVQAAGVEVESHTYDAPHSFFDRTFSQNQTACEDSWRRILEFTQRRAAGLGSDAR
jgi:carboxymethylenebutenolidase